MEDSATSVTSIWTSLNSWFTSTVFFILLNLMIATIVFTSNLPTNNNQQNHHQQEENQEDDDHRKQDSPTADNHHHRNQAKFSRSPSILHRLKSFNFYPQRPEQEFSPETHYHLQELEVAATQYVFNQPLHYQHSDFDPIPSDQVASVPDFETHFDSDPTHQEILKEDTNSEDAHEEEKELEDEFESLDEVYSRLKGGNVDRSNSDGVIQRKPPPPRRPAKMKKSASMKVGFSHFDEEEIVEARRPETMRERKSAVRATEDDDDVEVDAKADDFINKFKNDLMLQRIESIAGRSK